jgi:hypothetical protein
MCLQQRLRRVPAPVVDAGLAVAVTIGIRLAPGPGKRPDAVAYALGLIIAALTLARRRWPISPIWSMWTKGSRARRSTPAKARRTGKPSPSKPEGAVVTESTGRRMPAARRSTA